MTQWRVADRKWEEPGITADTFIIITTARHLLVSHNQELLRTSDTL